METCSKVAAGALIAFAVFSSYTAPAQAQPKQLPPAIELQVLDAFISIGTEVVLNGVSGNATPYACAQHVRWWACTSRLSLEYDDGQSVSCGVLIRVWRGGWSIPPRLSDCPAAFLPYEYMSPDLKPRGLRLARKMVVRP